MSRGRLRKDGAQRPFDSVRNRGLAYARSLNKFRNAFVVRFNAWTQFGESDGFTDLPEQGISNTVASLGGVGESDTQQCGYEIRK
jgi:hypothetical protein